MSAGGATIMGTNDDEREERERQQKERERLSLTDRLLGRPPRKTASGFDDLRSKRRTGRVVQLPIRLHPRVRAIVGAIMERDQHPSLVVFFEEMLAAYMQIHGPIDETKLPTDEELVRRLEDERDKRDE
jgi:hypothetical protein